jgi:hypothetical protein
MSWGGGGAAQACTPPPRRVFVAPHDPRQRRRHLPPCAHEGGRRRPLAGERRRGRLHRREPARPQTWGLRGQRRDAPRKAVREAAARGGAGHRRRGPCRGRGRGDHLPGDRGTWLHQREARPRRLVQVPGAGRRRGRRLRPHRGGAGEEGHRRVRLGQPDRPDARRPRPERRHRRRRPEPPPLGGLRRHPRVLRQRLRRPGPDARPLRTPPLPGGPRATDLDAAQELSGRVRHGDRAGAQGGVRREVPRCSRGRVARPLQGSRRAARPRAHPRGPRRHQHLLRSLVLGEGALRVGDRREVPRGDAAEGSHLRREAAAAEVQEGRPAPPRWTPRPTPRESRRATT